MGQADQDIPLYEKELKGRCVGPDWAGNSTWGMVSLHS